MALDATLAGPSANSYLTVAAADAFAESDLGRNREAWAAATVEDREAALIRATREIDVAVGRVDSPYDPYQALLFPRYTDLAYGTETVILPGRLGWATYAQAAFILRNANVLDDAASFRARGLSNFSNPDGTSGAVAGNFDEIGLAPGVSAVVTELSQGAIIGTIVTT